jgi:hypothetical protein
MLGLLFVIRTLHFFMKSLNCVSIEEDKSVVWSLYICPRQGFARVRIRILLSAKSSQPRYPSQVISAGIPPARWPQLSDLSQRCSAQWLPPLKIRNTVGVLELMAFWFNWFNSTQGLSTSLSPWPIGTYGPGPSGHSSRKGHRPRVLFVQVGPLALDRGVGVAGQ